MIEFIDLNRKQPYRIFLDKYQQALEKKQKNIEAIAISSFNPKTDEVESRFVNLKYVIKDEWIFFSNYNSPKAHHILKHDQISALIYWEKINVQIRMRAKVRIASKSISDDHFRNRKVEKNALSISSDQSKKTSSYEEVEQNYKNTLKDKNLLKTRPSFWGGFSFSPYYFEFWKGHSNRLNKRVSFQRNFQSWEKHLLQP